MYASLPECAISTLVAEYDAVEQSIEVVCEKRFDDDVVVAAHFQDQAGRQRRAMVGLRWQGGVWHAIGGFSGSRVPTVSAYTAWSSGGWSSSRIDNTEVRGFWVREPSARAVRATDIRGRTREDEIRSSVAILMSASDFDIQGATVALVGRDGNVIVPRLVGQEAELSDATW